MNRRWSALTAVTALLVGCSALEVDPPVTSTEVATTTTSPSTTTSSSTTTTTVPLLTLEGAVMDDQGTPVVAASVLFADETLSTDTSGQFVIESVAGGDVHISKAGWIEATFSWDGVESVVEVEMVRQTVRGLHVSGVAAADDVTFSSLLQLADTTAVNTFVFDTKQEGGTVLYDTSVLEAHDIGAVEVAYEPSQRLQQTHDAGLYAITRIVTFEDSFRVKARPEEKLAGHWIDPRSESAWQYNIDLGVEACQLGFDEIQYDYVRFPAGKTAKVSGQLNLTQDERVGAIAGFLGAARAQLEPMGCAISADIFGIVVSTENDQGLGQRPEELSKELDAVSPMVYPSHYADGWLGFPDPNDYPYEVTADAIDNAMGRIDAGSSVRPWLQAFWWTNAQIRSSIQAAEDRGVGWMMWNVRSNFDSEALPGADEVEG